MNAIGGIESIEEIDAIDAIEVIETIDIIEGIDIRVTGSFLGKAASFLLSLSQTVR